MYHKDVKQSGPTGRFPKGAAGVRLDVTMRMRCATSSPSVRTSRNAETLILRHEVAVLPSPPRNKPGQTLEPNFRGTTGNLSR